MAMVATEESLIEAVATCNVRILKIEIRILNIQVGRLVQLLSILQTRWLPHLVPSLEAKPIGVMLDTIR